MTFEAVMRALENAGTAQNRKVYARHGVGPVMFGVSYAELGALRKKLGTDTHLAQALWKSGNHDARVLATMVAEPARLPAAVLEAWLADLDSYVLTDAFSKLAACREDAVSRLEAWTESPEEWPGRCGWNMVAILAGREGALPDSFFVPFLERIARDIHGSKNRVRDAMNNALISIGARNATLRVAALELARRIGVVQVDHGETGCKTPDAAAYIEKIHARRRAQKSVRRGAAAAAGKGKAAAPVQGAGRKRRA